LSFVELHDQDHKTTNAFDVLEASNLQTTDGFGILESGFCERLVFGELEGEVYWRWEGFGYWKV